MTAPFVVRIRLRHADLDTFVEKFAPNVTRGGVFLATRHAQPVGALVGFEVQLSGGQAVLSGQGKVTWVREWNPAEPARAYGMGVQFVSLDANSRTVLARILRHKGGGQVAAESSSGRSGPIVAEDVSAALRARSGPVAAAPVDTAVDLAAELGVDPAILRGLIDRTWLSSARSDDDLSELLKAEPAAQASLAEALADLPRFLQAQSPRRRPSGKFRAIESASEPVPVTPPSSPPSARLAVPEPDLDELAANGAVREAEASRDSVGHHSGGHKLAN